MIVTYAWKMEMENDVSMELQQYRLIASEENFLLNFYTTAADLNF